MTEVAITGLGLVTGLGVGVDRYWSRLCAGDRALTAASALTKARLAPEIAATAPSPPGTGFNRRDGLFRVALTEAMTAAGLPRLPEDCLVVTVAQTPAVTTTGAGVDEFVSPFAVSPPGVPASARVTCLSQACASVAIATTLARLWIRAGRFALAVVAGAFALSRYDHTGMQVVGCLSDTGARPFDTARNGTSLGEGAGAIILEDIGTARARGARPLAVVAGAAVRVQPHSSGAATETAWATDCMRAALVDAGTTRVDYVHAHATGTRQGDTAELASIEEIAAEMGWRHVPIGADKGAIGHLMHLSGAPGIAAALGVLRYGVAPGVPGLNQPESTTSALDLRAAAQPCAPARTTVVNSFGFGGNNAVLVLTEAGPDPSGTAP